MFGKKRAFPPGVEINHPFDLEFFLPYRIHRLAVKIGYVGQGTDGVSFSLLKQSGFDFKAREWRLIVSLACRGPLTNSEVANLASMETATVTRASKTLISHGLIRSKQTKSDKRKVLLSLTAKGAELFDSLSEARLRQVEALESCLTKQEIDAFYRILNKLDSQASSQEIDAEIPEVDWG